MPLTPQENQRVHVLTALERGTITMAQAVEALALTERQVWRLRANRRAARRPSSMGTTPGRRGTPGPPRSARRS